MFPSTCRENPFPHVLSSLLPCANSCHHFAFSLILASTMELIEHKVISVYMFPFYIKCNLGIHISLLLFPSIASWRGRCFHHGFYGQSDICVEQGKEWKNLYFAHVADTTWSLYLFSCLCPGCWDILKDLSSPTILNLTVKVFPFLLEESV